MRRIQGLKPKCNPKCRPYTSPLLLTQVLTHLQCDTKCKMPPTLHKNAQQPLTDSELVFLQSCVLQKPHGLPVEELYEFVASCINEARSKPKIPGTLVKQPVNVKQIEVVHRAVARDIPSFFEKTDVLSLLNLTYKRYVLVPPVESCLHCSSTSLKLIRSSFFPWFFPLGDVPSKGSVYSKMCRNCDCQHNPDGYILPGQPAGSERIVAYPLYLRHPEWFFVTRETVLARGVLKMHDALLHHAHAGFSTTTLCYNEIWDLGASPLF